MMSSGQGANANLGAHEVLGMSESLMQGAAKTEMLAFLAQQAQDPQLKSMLERQRQAAMNDYEKGVRVLQMAGQNPAASMDGMMNYSFSAGGAAQLGLRHPSVPAPSMGGQGPSDRTIGMHVLSMHKSSAVFSMTFALECTAPALRRHLVDCACLCDQMAYETWSYMNSKGWYQVPTLEQKTTNTMMHAFQAPGTMGQMPQIQ